VMFHKAARPRIGGNERDDMRLYAISDTVSARIRFCGAAS
jgi:hypothetical protein